MLTTLISALAARVADYRTYRRVVAELEQMSHHELMDLKVYRSDLQAEALRRLRDR